MVVARKNITFAALLDFMEAELSNGVMVAQQVLVLFVVVRIRLGQQGKWSLQTQAPFSFYWPMLVRAVLTLKDLPTFIPSLVPTIISERKECLE